MNVAVSPVHKSQIEFSVTVPFEEFDVLAREHVEDVLVAQPPRRVAGAGLLGAEDGAVEEELHAGDGDVVGGAGGDRDRPGDGRAGCGGGERDGGRDGGAIIGQVESARARAVPA